MKKIFVLFSAVLILCSAGCRKSTVSERTGKTGVANPVKTVTQEQLLEITGMSFGIPEGAEEVCFSTISEKTAQMVFLWRGCKCTARALATGELQVEDISGMYYSWEWEGDSRISYCEAKTKYATRSDGNIVAVCNWIDKVPGILYSFSIVVPGIGPGDISDVQGLVEKLAKETWVPAQGDVE